MQRAEAEGHGPSGPFRAPRAMSAVETRYESWSEFQNLNHRLSTKMACRELDLLIVDECIIIK